MNEECEQIGMKKEHCEAIRINFSKLVNNCNIDLLLPKLLEKHVFTESMLLKYRVSYFKYKLL